MNLEFVPERVCYMIEKRKKQPKFSPNALRLSRGGIALAAKAKAAAHRDCRLLFGF